MLQLCRRSPITDTISSARCAFNATHEWRAHGMVVPRDTKRDERVQIRWYHWLWHAPKVRVRDLNWPAAPVVRRIIDRFVAQGATRVQVVRERISVHMIVLNGFDVRVHGRPRPAGVPKRGPRVVLRF